MQAVPRRFGMVGGLCAARRAVFLALWLVAALIAPALAEPVFPALTGRVVDEARLFNTDQITALTADLSDLEARTTDQLVVVTLPSLQGYPIEEFGYQLGRHWSIGQKDKDNGVLLIVAPTERKVRIEVGRGLEPVLTDAFTKLIIENTILPKFRKGDFAGGIKAGAADIVAALSGDVDAVTLRSRTRTADTVDQIFIVVFLLVWFGIILLAIWIIFSSARHGTGSGSGRSSGGGWSSGSSSGGGFSGGGGSFGGGGSSGSW